MISLLTCLQRCKIKSLIFIFYTSFYIYGPLRHTRVVSGLLCLPVHSTRLYVCNPVRDVIFIHFIIIRRYSAGTVQVQCRYTAGTLHVQGRYSVGTAQVHCRYRAGTGQVQCRYSAGTTQVQRRYSASTVQSQFFNS